MTKSTITDLPKDIANAVPDWEQNPLIKKIVEEAKAGEFHDYENNLYVTPKVQLAGMLHDTKHSALLIIRQAVISGEYDE